ncbi:MAG: Gfo/Idh/MocA family oxidoreductase [Clostridiales bacterium]|nr:Gfo/Idh/MocA family oxidoreductase [Clostridiales bacterium]
MAEQKLKVAIIGAGNIAQNAHLPTYKDIPDVEIVAIADWNLERAQEAAKKFGIPNAFASCEEAFALPGLDIADICVWNKSHAPVAIAAAKRGLHILCEKPMAWDMNDAYAMEAAIKESGKVFVLGVMNRYRKDVQLLKEMANAGKFGDIYYGKAIYLRRRGTPLGWFTDTQKSGGGPVIDIGVHCIDRTWYLMGCPRPVRVSASTSYRIGDYQTKGVSRWVALDSDVTAFDTEDSASGVIHFENGASMLFEVSWAINLPNEEVSFIAGTKAGAKLGSPMEDKPVAVYGEDCGFLTDNEPYIEKSPFFGFGGDNPFKTEILELVNCIRTGKKPISPLEDALGIERILMGIYESAKAGKEITL